MATITDVLTRILNFTDQEFYQLDASTIEDRESSLLDMDFFGVAVNAPKQVFTDQHDTLPMLIAIRCDGERDWDYPLPENCVLAATNLLDGTVSFANALMTEKDIESRGGNLRAPDQPRPPAEELEGEGVAICAIDLRSQLPLEWQTATWSVALLHFDWPSNTVQIYVKDPANLKPPILPKAVKPLPHPKAGVNLPTYQHHPQSPPMPSKGACFRLISKEKEGEEHWSVYGSFNFKFKDVYIPEPNTQHAFKDGNTLTVSAVIPVTLVILARGWEIPRHVTWNVPYYGAMLNPRESGQGYFALDITNVVGELAAGEYISYVLLDGNVYGPESLVI